MSEFRRYLRISAHLQEIAAACDFVVDAARSAGFDDTALHHCWLAVDEACTNIIEHGYAGSADDSAPIEITVRFTAGELVIEIVDRSPAFDPLSQPEPDLQSFLDDINPGGVGRILHPQSDGSRRISSCGWAQSSDHDEAPP
ncbi:ATP-binding protein [Kamptonema cortianum]|nr:ATP-binding protein [Kamptonema cortianum]